MHLLILSRLIAIVKSEIISQIIIVQDSCSVNYTFVALKLLKMLDYLSGSIYASLIYFKGPMRTFREVEPYTNL